MGKPDWGKRYTCYKCGKSYFDMNKPEVKCPACGANPAKAPSKGGAKSKIQALMPKEETDSDLPASDNDSNDDDIDTPSGGLDSEVELPEESSEV